MYFGGIFIPQSLVCFIFFPMIYGLVFLGHTRVSPADQRGGILQFSRKHEMPIDEFVSFDINPGLLNFKPGDTIICYAWNCLCRDMAFLRMFVQHAAKNGISIYSTTSKYHIDASMDMNAIAYALAMYEDMRFNFWSNKSVEGATKRIVSGRRAGSKNKSHILDGREKVVCDMYAAGFSMYAIAKKLKVTAPTIKRFLASQS